ncbi:D-alanine--D-alanine ligase [Candidatus Berkelbacteria bacterium]|nr:D-alanine--D-alanine ligase [Candidatus Berkelbacteria bacterium]
MKKKIKVGIIFGGKSAEHEVSLQSAKNVIEAIDQDKYEPVLIGVDKKGKWFLADSSKFLLNSGNPKLIKLNNETSQSVALVPQSDGKIANLDTHESEKSIDVVFPILHGPFGEDGTMQGLLKLANIPFVGASVLGSAVGMDKDVMKRLLRDAGIPIGKFLTLREKEIPIYDEVVKNLGLPFFVKPANMGSSVGISKVIEEKDFKTAIGEAFKYDRKILIEENIAGREIECSVLGNDDPIASIPGEVIPNHDFYSYEAKYLDEYGAAFEIPAKLPDDIVKKVQELAVKTFKTLTCEGLGRIDFFLKKNGDVLIDEINTIPGFTSISMYPKLWEASGISYTELIDRLIQLAFERFEKEQKLKTFYDAK